MVFPFVILMLGAASDSVLFSFGGAYRNGWFPASSLIADEDGNLYGTTQAGGARCHSHCGTVFRLTPNPHSRSRHYAETVLYAFRAGSDGDLPSGGVVADANGNLFGATTLGGT